MELCNTDWDENKFHIALDWWACWYKSLSELLFNTPFLNLLERKKEIWLSQLYSEVINMDSSDKVKIKLTTTGYHTCRLAILDNDKSRVEYIEQSTL